MKGGRVRHLGVAALVAVAAILAHLPALRTWWCLDDWGQLARAAGYLTAPDGIPARFLSQHLWWRLTWPVLGLNALGHSVLRLVLHAAAALAVVRIGRRTGLEPAQQLVSGLLFAAAPVSFTILYWASGIQELLAGVCALWAVERWLARGRWNIFLAGFLALCSIAAKESGLGLPVMFTILLLVCREHSPRARIMRWGVIVVLAGAVLFEIALVRRHFASGPSDPYATGGLMVMLGNLGKFGWWTAIPGVVFTGQMTWPRAWCGIGVLVVWAVAGGIFWRKERRLPALALVMALLSIAPTLPLLHQVRPYMGYILAACAALTVGSLLPGIRSVSLTVAILGLLAAVVWGNLTMTRRMARADDAGVPADPIVRAVAASRRTATDLRAALDRLHPNLGPDQGQGPEQRLAIYQPRLRPSRGPADPGDPTQPVHSEKYQVLEGPLGASLIAGVRDKTVWTATLLELDPGYQVVCEKAHTFEAWGGMDTAVLYAAELQIVMGNFPEAVAFLAYAYEHFGPQAVRLPPEGAGVPARALAAKGADFARFLDRAVAKGKIAAERVGVYGRFCPGG